MCKRYLLVNVVFVFLVSFDVISSFSLTSIMPESIQTVPIGGKITLECKVDGYYEWCKFVHGNQICDFEWNDELWNITTLDCDDFAGRAEFVGTYNNYHCAITLSDIKPTDAGEWKCEIESYYNGYYRGYGYNVTGSMMLEVPVPTTTTTTTTTTTPTTTQSRFISVTNKLTAVSLNSKAPKRYEQTSTKSDPDNDDTQTICIIIVVVVVVAVILAAIVILFLHYKHKLPESCYSITGKKQWKPVLPNEEFPVDEEDLEDQAKHPSIIKNNADPTMEDTIIDKKAEQKSNNGVSNIANGHNETGEQETEKFSSDEQKPLST